MSRIISISTDQISRCAKCNRSNQMISRHHMGNDGLLKLFSPQLAQDYDLFLDCCPLCDECHMMVHWIYQTQIVRVPWTMLSQKAILRHRTKFIRLCQRWLKGKITKIPPISTEFSTRWATRMHPGSSNLIHR